MPRLPRYVIPGQPQHVIQRGNNRGATFFNDDDYTFYRKCLKEACQKYHCSVHAYVFMTNHVHLILTPEAHSSIGNVMQSIGRRYVPSVNRKQGRTGTLWEGRYRATLIDSARYLLTCHRYIELNPVRAGIAAHPISYEWSSYRRNAHGEADGLLRHHPLYDSLGETAEARQQAYQALFRSQLDSSTLELIRESTNKAWALGDASFRSEVEASQQRRAAARYAKAEGRRKTAIGV